ncbi:hypothetical protein [Paucibacter sp. Y2R2-4]|uniref:hypothetical protein n=1 Tax=Paucibacter sp. Y2R2-4 TaxID=2893553 RepID=UPI0021E3E9E3|nr:hypothetical protein [Paucibacter sp. Y2R2-4]MCV2349642.1 hypothetical protein [Paucibacter sp. Y2R2-4]
MGALSANAKVAAALPGLESQCLAAQELIQAGSLEAGFEAIQRLLAAIQSLELPNDAGLRELEFRVRLLSISGLIQWDRFDEVLRECTKMLDLVSLDQPSSQRALLMSQLAFAHTQFGMPEQALRAAQVAIQDSLLLKDRLLASQALERAATTYFFMGDGTSAERFMFEALGYMDQHSPVHERLRRFSNAVHLSCSLHDMYQEAGQAPMALAILHKVDSFADEADSLVPALAGEYITYMWRANLARWHRRCGRLQLARGAFLAALSKAESAGWHAVRRPVLLELALMAETQGDTPAALDLLVRVFEPGEIRVRDVVAMPTYQALERLYKASSQEDLAKMAAQGMAARQTRRDQAAQAVQADLPQLSARIVAALAEADRARLDEVIRSLREQRRQSRGGNSADSGWAL